MPEIRKKSQTTTVKDDNGGVPDKLKGMVFWNVDFAKWNGRDTQLLAECPFCGKSRKFSVNVETTQWRCFACSAGYPGKQGVHGGNDRTFLQYLYDNVLQWNDKLGAKLAADRKLLSPESLKAWGLKFDSIGTPVVPGYSADNILKTLYRYIPNGKGGRFLCATPGMGQHLQGRASDRAKGSGESKKQRIECCEGYWDAVAYWETLSRCRINDGGEYVETGNPESSLIADIEVYAAPGANSWTDSWLHLFDGKDVTLLFDSDHPKKRCGKCKKSSSLVLHPDKCGQVKCGGDYAGPVIEPIGWLGMRRIVDAIKVRAERKPQSVKVVKWGEHGYASDLKSGYDLRDYLTDGNDPSTLENRLTNLSTFRGLFIEDIPPEWMEGASVGGEGESSGIKLTPLRCEMWAELENVIKKSSFKLTPRLRIAWIVSLATCATTNASGTSQNWLRIIGPPSSGKSTICDALNVSDSIYAKSKIKGLFSAYKTDKEGSEDHSLLPKLKGKTLLVKDADSLMKAPNVAEIMSELRDAFDKRAGTESKNAMGRDYLVNFTMILAGTGAIAALDQNDLGERFLSVRVVEEKADHGLTDEINERVFNRAFRNMGKSVNGRADSMTDPRMIEAYRMTGGYLDYLRANAERLFVRITNNEEQDTVEIGQRVCHMGDLVSYMRARPGKSKEHIEKEMSGRLVDQFTRLAVAIAAVLNRDTIDEDVLAICRSVTIDSSRGHVHIAVKYVAHMMDTTGEGCELRFIAAATHETEQEQKNMLRFLKKIGVFENYDLLDDEGNKVSNRQRWRLTTRVKMLYDSVMLDKKPTA